jgi:threonine dehydratase
VINPEVPEIEAVGLAEVERARGRLGADVHRTPLLSSRQLGAIAGGRVFLKCENLQRTGSFKARGALNAVRSLDAGMRARGVTTYSSGNHGQALAWAAALEGIRAVIFMPTTAPRTKVDAARGYGAEVRFAGTTSPERKAAAEDAVAREGLAMVPPFDDARIVAGQGTCLLEAFEDVPEPDVVLVPVGGGGLCAGSATVAAALRPATRVLGIEPTTADAMTRALAAGQVVTITPPRTIADGLMPLAVGALPFAVARRHVAGTVLVDDDAIRRAVRFLATRAKLVVEPSGAVGVAALLSGLVRLDGRTAIAVLSGGNVAPEFLAEVLADTRA